MIVFEFKAKGTKQQHQRIDEAIRISQFIRNKCLRFWIVCNCGCILDRDHNAAINILAKALKQTGYDLSTVGRTETFTLRLRSGLTLVER